MSVESNREAVPVDELSSTGDLGDLVERRRRFAELTAEKKDLAAEQRRVQRELDELEDQVLEDYVELGTDSMRVVVGEQRYTVHLAPELYARPHKSGVDERGNDVSTEEDWEAACTAVREAGRPDLVAERFNTQSLTGWIRELREQHGPGWREALPPGLADAIEISDRQRVRVRKV